MSISRIAGSPAICASTPHPLSLRGQLYRRGICLLPAAKRQIPRWPDLATIRNNEAPSFPEGRGWSRELGYPASQRISTARAGTTTICVGTAALGCPAERSSGACLLQNTAELRSAGRTRTSAPTWSYMVTLTCRCSRRSIFATSSAGPSHSIAFPQKADAVYRLGTLG